MTTITTSEEVRKERIVTTNLNRHIERVEVNGREAFIYRPRFTRRELSEFATLLPPVTVPEGRSGSWQVERFTLSRQEAQRQNACMDSFLLVVFIDRFPAVQWHLVRTLPGTYTRLMRDGQCIMSDVLSEIADHVAFVRAAHGHILISGLGLGAVLQACLLKPEVDHATVVERSSDVLALVGPHYRAMFGDRVTLIHEDALAYRPPRGARYGAVWHDIWDDISPVHLPQMEALHRVYAPHTDWQDSWGYDFSRFLVSLGWTPSDRIIAIRNT